MATRVDMAVKYREIVALADRGLTARSIARQFNEEEGRVREIVREARLKQFEGLRESDPLEHVRNTLAMYEQAIEEFSLIAGDRSATPQTRVVAIRSRVEAVHAYFGLLQEIGLAPRELGSLRVVLEAEDIARDLAQLFMGWGLPPERFDEALAVLEGRGRELPPPVEGGA